MLALSDDSPSVFHQKGTIWVFDLMRVKATFAQPLAMFYNNFALFFLSNQSWQSRKTALANDFNKINSVMKVKNDHRSKFSNSSNWKEEAWKKDQGFNGIRVLCPGKYIPHRSLRKHPFLLALRQRGRFARRNWIASSVWNFCRWVADVPPRETSLAAKSEEKRMLLQANHTVNK